MPTRFRYCEEFAVTDCSGFAKSFGSSSIDYLTKLVSSNWSVAHLLVVDARSLHPILTVLRVIRNAIRAHTVAHWTDLSHLLNV